MAERTQIFNAASPAAPSLTKGMRLGLSGVSAPPLQTLGPLSGVSATPGHFNDLFGYGSGAFDGGGNLYVGDNGNTRWQKFIKTVELWAYSSLVNASAALGASGSSAAIIFIDEARQEIHLASYSQAKTGDWIGVWDVSQWPNLTVANRKRSYGSNVSGSGSGAGVCGQGMWLLVVGDIAYVCSGASPYRSMAWNHLTGAVVTDFVEPYPTGGIVYDPLSSRFFQCSQSGSKIGLRQVSSAFANVARLDDPDVTGSRYTRLKRFELAGGVTSLVVYDGRVYARESSMGRIMAWNAADNSWSDEFLRPGGASDTANLGESPGGYMAGTSLTGMQGRMMIVIGSASQSDDLLVWSSNADNDASQSFLSCFPVSVAAATWIKTNWSTAANTIKYLPFTGANLSAENCRVRVKKNAGAWTTITYDKFLDAPTWAALGTWTEGDTATFELQLSTWVRLDGHATLKAVRNKLTPENVSGLLVWDDPLGDVFVPQQTGLLRGTLAGGRLIGRIST